MWTKENRRFCERKELRYPGDPPDDEWALAAPQIPPAKRGERRRTVVVREVLSGNFYVVSTGCQWSARPNDLPPKSTEHDYLSCGPGTARSRASMRNCSWTCVS